MRQVRENLLLVTWDAVFRRQPGRSPKAIFNVAHECVCLGAYLFCCGVEFGVALKEIETKILCDRRIESFDCMPTCSATRSHVVSMVLDFIEASDSSATCTT